MQDVTLEKGPEEAEELQEAAAEAETEAEAEVEVEDQEEDTAEAGEEDAEEGHSANARGVPPQERAGAPLCPMNAPLAGTGDTLKHVMHSLG